MKEKFWLLVDKEGKSNRQCWEWVGKYRNEYGSFYHNGKRYFPHILSYEMTHGTLLPGSVVLHKCDNPKCVNPNHLKSGTQSDNMVDAFKKGRLYINKVSKLTTDKVDQIRALKGKHTNSVIAEMFDVNRRTIDKIFTGEHWSHHKS